MVDKLNVVVVGLQRHVIDGAEEHVGASDGVGGRLEGGRRQRGRHWRRLSWIHSFALLMLWLMMIRLAKLKHRRTFVLVLVVVVVVALLTGRTGAFAALLFCRLVGLFLLLLQLLLLHLQLKLKLLLACVVNVVSLVIDIDD